MPDRPPPDPADHAENFSRCYADDLEIVAGQAMMDMGLTGAQMGERDAERGGDNHSFCPGERTAGGLSPADQVTLDSGVMNPAKMDDPYGEACGNHACVIACRPSSPTSWRSTNTGTTSWS